MKPVCQNIVKKDSLYPLIKHHVRLCQFLVKVLTSPMAISFLGDGPFASSSAAIRRRKSCPMHKGQTVGPKIINIPADTSKPIVQVRKINKAFFTVPKDMND